MKLLLILLLIISLICISISFNQGVYTGINEQKQHVKDSLLIYGESNRANDSLYWRTRLKLKMRKEQGTKLYAMPDSTIYKERMKYYKLIINSLKNK